MEIINTTRKEQKIYNPPDAVTVELSREEAQFLFNLMFTAVCGREDVDRGYSTSIYQGLRKVGFAMTKSYNQLVCVDDYTEKEPQL